MKKILYSLFAMFMATATFTSCEDVPMPYNYPSGGSDTGSGDEIAAEGDGSLDNPFNSVAANAYGATLETGGISDKDYYIKGKVVSVKEEYTSNYGNGTYYISVDGTSNGQFYVYRAMYLGNKKYTDGQENIKVGDEVIICGKIMNYNGTIETQQNGAYLYSLNGKTAGGETTPDEGVATGTGTKDDPYNSVAANKYVSSLEANVESENEVYIKGKISSIKNVYNTSYGNATFYISDDGSTTNQFYVFRAMYLGNEKYTEGQTNIQVGDEVVVCGKVINYYGNTPETVASKAYLVSLKSNGGGDTPTPSEGDLTLDPASLGLSNGTAVTDLTMSDGTMITFDGGGNSNVPKFYTSGNNIRMYPNNSVTVTASKNIDKIVIYCDTYNNILCNAEGAVGSSAGTVAVDDTKLNITGCGNNVVTITNNSAITGTESQVRITKMVIYYAK